MRKISIAMILTTILFTQTSFADDQEMSSSENKSCAMIAKSCLDAGFTRDENADKKFWFGCMKPLLMGHEVKGVTMDAKTVKDCRNNKIAEMKKELKEMEKASAMKGKAG